MVTLFIVAGFVSVWIGTGSFFTAFGMACFVICLVCLMWKNYEDGKYITEREVRKVLDKLDKGKSRW